MVPEAAYIDADVYIAHIKGETGREVASEWIAAAERGEFTVHASTLLIVELLRWNGDKGKVLAPEESEALDQLLRSSVLHEVDYFVARDARRLRRDHNMDSFDSIHLATAQRAKVTHLITYNGQDYPETPGLMVCKPFPLKDQGTLDAYLGGPARS